MWLALQVLYEEKETLALLHETVLPPRCAEPPRTARAPLHRLAAALSPRLALHGLRVSSAWSSQGMQEDREERDAPVTPALASS